MRQAPSHHPPPSTLLPSPPNRSSPPVLLLCFPYRYDADYPLESLLQAWDNVLTAMAGKWNIFALDIKNEPHGMATWGAGEDLTDWNKVWEEGRQ